MNRQCDVAVIGGGASGLAAAVSAARNGRSVVVCERLNRPGRKLLATGGGRSNLLNDGVSAGRYTATDRTVPEAVFARFGAAEIRAFFLGLGLELVNEDDRVYPATGQAASVLKVLELEAGRLGVAVECGFEAVDASAMAPAGGRRAGGPFRVASADGRLVEAGALILAGGGRSYPALGSNGSCHALAARFGHSIVAPVPSAVPLLVRDRLCHVLQGQKVRAAVRAVIGGRSAAEAEGDLLFTQYGLSGTAALDVSEALSVALNRERRTDAVLEADLVPGLEQGALAGRLRERLAGGWPAADLLAGILPEKFGPAVMGQAPLPVREAERAVFAATLAGSLKKMEFKVYGTRGWNEADFTSGGVDAREVRGSTLGSKIVEGLYLAGEVLDVQGPRGGFNLAWAWASGLLAGLTE